MEFLDIVYDFNLINMVKGYDACSQSEKEFLHKEIPNYLLKQNSQDTVKQIRNDLYNYYLLNGDTDSYKYLFLMLSHSNSNVNPNTVFINLFNEAFKFLNQHIQCPFGYINTYLSKEYQYLLLPEHYILLGSEHNKHLDCFYNELTPEYFSKSIKLYDLGLYDISRNTIIDLLNGLNTYLENRPLNQKLPFEIHNVFINQHDMTDFNKLEPLFNLSQLLITVNVITEKGDMTITTKCQSYQHVLDCLKKQ